MEIKIFVLITVCCVLVQGNSLDSPRLKQRLLAKFLSLARGQDAKRWLWDSSESESIDEEENLAIDKIQSLLYEIAETLAVFKEKTTVSTEPSVTVEPVTDATAPPTTAPPTTTPPTTGTTATPVTETVGPAETTTSWWNVKRAKKNKQQDEQLIRNSLVEILKKELHRQR